MGQAAGSRPTDHGPACSPKTWQRIRSASSSDLMVARLLLRCKPLGREQTDPKPLPVKRASLTHCVQKSLFPSYPSLSSSFYTIWIMYQYCELTSFYCNTLHDIKYNFSGIKKNVSNGTFTSPIQMNR